MLELEVMMISYTLNSYNKPLAIGDHLQKTIINQDLLESHVLQVGTSQLWGFNITKRQEVDMAIRCKTMEVR